MLLETEILASEEVDHSLLYSISCVLFSFFFLSRNSRIMGPCKCLMCGDIDVVYNFNIYCRILSRGMEKMFSSLKVVSVFHNRSKIVRVKNEAINSSFSWDILNREIKWEKKGTNLVVQNSEV